MTLAEALQTHENDFVYIGSKSGYFYIGNAKEAFNELPKIGNKYLKGLKLLLKKYKEIFHDKNYAKTKAEIKAFKPFLEREVVDEYKRLSVEPLGTILIVDGSELGDYWSYDEYLEGKAREKRRKKNERSRNKCKTV